MKINVTIKPVKPVSSVLSVVKRPTATDLLYNIARKLHANRPVVQVFKTPSGLRMVLGNYFQEITPSMGRLGLVQGIRKGTLMFSSMIEDYRPDAKARFRTSTVPYREIDSIGQAKVGGKTIQTPMWKITLSIPGQDTNGHNIFERFRAHEIYQQFMKSSRGTSI